MDQVRPDHRPAPLHAAAAWVRIAVLVPCYNEQGTIERVVRGFQTTLPGAAIYVYDNNSTDRTAACAAAAGASVRHEQQRGKGNVVRRMFADVDADIYVLVDGDDTYDPATAPAMIDLLLSRQLDMVTAVRMPAVAGAYRPGHQFGNALLTGVVRRIFGRGTTDMLSGYRAFSRRFVKSFPALAAGFETETEFTVHALELRMALGEVPTRYGERPVGSVSKLHTYSDGFRILRTILVLVKEERPLQFFSIAAAVLLAVGIGLGLPVIGQFLRTGLVPRLPTAVLATSLVLLSCLSAACGLILDSVTRGRRELKRLSYLAIPPTAGRDGAWPIGSAAPDAPIVPGQAG